MWNRNYHPTKTIRIIQIVLLALIVIGVVLVLTQKIWVPKLVERIMASENLAQ